MTFFLMCLQASPAKDPWRPRVKFYGQAISLLFPLIFLECSSTACLLNLLSLSPKEAFLNFFVNVKFFSLPHKPVPQPFSLEMENILSTLCLLCPQKFPAL